MRFTRKAAGVAASVAAFGLMAGVAVASDVDVAVVDVTAPTNAVTLPPGGSSPITINMSVTGNQVGTATFEVYTDWTLENGSWAGSDPQEFTVGPRAGGDPATTFSTSGTVSVDCAQATATDPFTLAAGAFDITNSNATGAKLAAGRSATYSVTVSGSPAASCVTTPTNRPPTVATAALDDTGVEGDTLSTSGAFSDPDGDTLTITKLSGAGTVQDNNDGTWSWSLATTDDASGTVVVQAEDPDGATVTDSFDFAAANADPIVGALTFNQVGTACGISVSAGFTDVGSGDTHASSIDWGDGSTADSTDPDASPVTGAHTFSGPGTYIVTVSVTDDDGGEDDATGSPVFKNRASAILDPVKSGVSNFKIGSSIPVKITVQDCAGTPVTTLAPTVSLVKLDSMPDGTNTDAGTAETATNGKSMLWNGELYHYVLSTKNSQLAGGTALTAGTYKLTVSDPSFVSNPTATFDLKK